MGLSLCGGLYINSSIFRNKKKWFLVRLLANSSPSSKELDHLSLIISLLVLVILLVAILWFLVLRHLLWEIRLRGAGRVIGQETLVNHTQTCKLKKSAKDLTECLTSNKGIAA